MANAVAARSTRVRTVGILVKQAMIIETGKKRLEFTGLIAAYLSLCTKAKTKSIEGQLTKLENTKD